MSVIQEPGSTRPGRAAGLVLIGVAVIAVVLGVITLLDGGEDGKPGGSPPPSNTSGNPQPPPPASQPSQPTSQPTQSNPPPVTSTTAPPAPPPPTAPDPKQVPLRVFNNSTIRNFAAQAAQDFRNDGWTVSEVGNYSESTIPTTTAYFSPGTDEEAAAKALAVKCGLKVAPRQPNFRFGPGVIVMITKDYCAK